MKWLVFILVLGLALQGAGQEMKKDEDNAKQAVPDTVFVKRGESKIDTLYITAGTIQPQVLVGTRFLPSSNKMISLKNNGLSPISLNILKDCDNSFDPSTYKDYPKFNEIKRDSDTLIIDVTVISNCCHNFLGEAEVVGKDTLNLIYTTYGSHCDCSCCFTLRFNFNTVMEERYQILRFVTINGDKNIVGNIPEKQ